MAESALISVLMSIAPETAQIVKTLVDRKLKTNEVLISLLALNLEQSKKTDCLITSIANLRGDMIRSGVLK